MASKLAPRLVFHAPCAFGPSGVTEETCKQMTAVVTHNLRGCTSTNCISPLRMCWACLRQGTKEVSANPKTGLCEFHSQNGKDARIPPKGLAGSGDERLDFTKLLTLTNVPSDMRCKAKYKVVDSSSVPMQEKKPKDAAAPRPKGRNRGALPTCLMTYRDPITQTDLTVGVLEVFEIALNLRNKHFTLKEIARRLGFETYTVAALMRLKHLEPAVKDMVSPDREPSDRIGLTMASSLAYLRPDLQEQTAIEYLEGRIRQTDVEHLLADQDNWHPSRL